MHFECSTHNLPRSFGRVNGYFGEQRMVVHFDEGEHAVIEAEVKREVQTRWGFGWAMEEVG